MFDKIGFTICVMAFGAFVAVLIWSERPKAKRSKGFSVPRKSRNDP